MNELEELADEYVAELRKHLAKQKHLQETKEERIRNYFGSPETNERLAEVARTEQVRSHVRVIMAKEKKHSVTVIFPLGTGVSKPRK